MDFELSEDQLALRDAARDLLDGQASTQQVRQVFDATSAPDQACWAQIVEQGWLAVEVPEADGGLGMGAVEVAVLAEEVGRHAAPVPFVSCVLARGALAAAGDDRADAIVNGEVVGAVAWSERVDAVAAERDGDSWVLTGRPDPVPWAPIASVCVVAAVVEGSGESALFAVDLDALGRPDAEPAMDRTRTTGWMHLDRTSAVHLGDGDAVTALLDRGAVFTAAEMLGSADTAMTMAVEYAKERVQFGKPIGSFQAVKHRCADMLVDVEGMRSTVFWAAWALSAGDDQSVAASTTKTWCSDASKRVMASALQVHGGIGFTWEHDLHFFMKRAQLEQLRFGDAVFHRERLAALLRPRVEAGTSVI